MDDTCSSEIYKQHGAKDSLLFSVFKFKEKIYNLRDLIYTLNIKENIPKLDIKQQSNNKWWDDTCSNETYMQHGANYSLLFSVLKCKEKIYHLRDLIYTFNIKENLPKLDIKQQSNNKWLDDTCSRETYKQHGTEDSLLISVLKFKGKIYHLRDPI